MTTIELMQKMELIGLAVQRKPISFNKFKKYADAHQYGSRSNKIYIVYCGLPKENLFGFYPPMTTKKESLEITKADVITTAGYSKSLKQKTSKKEFNPGFFPFKQSHKGLALSIM